MKNKLFLNKKVICLLLLVLEVCGCVTTAPQSNFYIFDSLAQRPISSTPFSKNILIGPVRVPSYVDRPNIVTRNGNNQLHLAEFHRWAAPLAENITAVLVKDLSTLLNTPHVAYYLNQKGRKWDYRIEIDIVKMHGWLGQKALLEAHWTIYKIGSRQPIFSKISTFQEDINGPEYSDLVEAWNRTLLSLSTEIAKKLLEFS